MTISPLGTSPLDTQLRTSSVSPASAAPVDSDGDHDGSAGATTTSVSPFAQFMSKLQSLEQTNPTEAKQVLTDIASKLNAEAKDVGGAAGDKLSALADKFTKAASTGDLSGLAPSSSQPGQAQGAQTGAGEHHAHHGHHSHATQAYSQNSGSTSLVDTLNSVLAKDTAATSSTTSAS